VYFIIMKYSVFLVSWMAFSKEIMFFIGNCCKTNTASKVTKFFIAKISNSMAILIIIIATITISITLIMYSKKILSLD